MLGEVVERKLIVPTALYALILISVILAAYTFVGLYVTKGESLSSIVFKSDPSDNDKVSALSKEVIPGETLNIRPYKYNDKEISFAYYNTQEGFNFISYQIDEEMTSQLSEDQLKRVDSIASNIYRPCCGVPASTPDCSHGFAARGLVKLLVKEGWTDEQIYEEVSIWNRFWWPKHYVGVALYLEKQDKSWEDLSPKELLSKEYSTSAASRKISSALGMSLF